MDGFYARKYSMVSKFGDIYDHVKDVVVMGVLIVMIYRYRPRGWLTWILVFVILAGSGILMVAHLGCQERVHDSNESDSLSYGKALCLGDLEDKLRTSRFFGCGTWTIILILVIISLEISKR